MKIIKLSAISFAIGLFLVACNQQIPEEVATVEPYANNPNAPLTNETLTDEFDYWAKDNLDLQRVGNVLERSRSPQEFESYLNSNDGINNLDLNGDGYADYISVDEYQDRDDYERGLSIYSRFGPNEVQEIGTVVFYRDDFNAPGARILITGNQQIYGDRYYYETNWMDRSLAIAGLLFSPRTEYYRSPYYYNYYPSGYQPYQVVDMPYYNTRIERLYPEPFFAYTTSPTFYSLIKIKSPNNGLHLGWTKARFVNPTREQAAFYKNYRGNPRGGKVDQGGKQNNQGGKQDNQGGNLDNQGGRPEKQGVRKDSAAQPDKQPKAGRNSDTGKGNPAKQNKGNNPAKDTGKPQKSDQGGKGNDGKGGGKGGGKGKP